MTRLFAFVLVSLLATGGCVSQSKYTKLQNQYNKLEKENDRLKGTTGSTGKNPTAAFKELQADLKPLVDKGLLSLEVVDGRVVIGMTADILFASGSARLSERGKDAVAELARALSRRAREHDFQVEGHTDNEAINTAEFPDNWHLGAERAITVVQAMVSAGFPSDHLSAASFGPFAPVGTNETAAGKARNRRIEVVLLPDLSTMPGYTELMNTSNARKRRK